MVVYEEYSVEQILPLILDRPRYITLETPVGPFKVKIHSKRGRLACLARSQTCVTCGRVGNIFRLEFAEHDLTSNRPHLNLYCVDQTGEYLMTRDHIFPKSRGGGDDQGNAQTMCYPCNMIKGDTLG